MSNLQRLKLSVPEMPPNEQLTVDEFRDELTSRIIGQTEAVDGIVDAYSIYLSGLGDTTKPVCSLLYLGPTGTGKTRIVEAVAEALGKNSLVGVPVPSIIKVDCGEYQNHHEIARLIGSPPGYLGHRETKPIFTQESLSRSHTQNFKLSFVLFDEIEKASYALWNLLLGVLDKARLSLGDNTTVDFSKCMIFMTSNVGAREMSDLVSKNMGFHGPNVLAGSSTIPAVVRSAARRKFSPEFINRLDSITVFRTLTTDELASILDLELTSLSERVLGSIKPFLLSLTRQAKQLILTDGFDERYGARHLKRSIDRNLVKPLARLVADGRIKQGDVVSAGVHENKLEFRLTE